MAKGPAAVALLWEMCQIPDYRKISAASHAELVATLFGFVMSDEGKIPADWFANQVALADRTDGDLDTLSNRLAQIRTWTFVSHHAAMARRSRSIGRAARGPSRTRCPTLCTNG